MTHPTHPNFTSTYRGLTKCLNSVLNVKALVGAFNQKKALVGVLSVIAQLRRLIVCSTRIKCVTKPSYQQRSTPARRLPLILAASAAAF